MQPSHCPGLQLSLPKCCCPMLARRGPLPALNLKYHPPVILIASSLASLSPFQWGPPQPNLIRIESYPPTPTTHCVWRSCFIFLHITLYSTDPWRTSESTKGNIKNKKETTVLSMKTCEQRNGGIKVGGCPGVNIKGPLCTFKFLCHRMCAARGRGFASWP